ncbi:MAG TPA: LamG-like jellyroll fold domain-containing protein, partial [Pseudonocardiaceae bacterium]|nr:LamG-like jellyroll fold domain-containing protein [Pseudonocardiaceae bacterium]
GPGVGDGTGVKFAPGTSSTGQLLQGQFTPPFGHGYASDTFTVEVWVNAGTSLPSWGVAGNENILGVYSAPGGLQALLYLNAGVPTFQDSSVTINGSGSIVNGGWHHLAVIRTHPAGYQAELVVDGVSAGTAATTATDRLASLVIGDGGPAVTAARFQGNAGQVLIRGATSAGYCADQFAAVGGYSGDTTDARIARYLGYAGLDSSSWTLDVGQTTVGTYPQPGKDVVSACQDMATTEGGVFSIRWDGKARLTNRRYRDATTPVLILDASVPALLDPDVWDPAFDESTLVNSSTANRSAESGTLSTQTYTDTVSLAAYGESDAPDITTYTLSDQDALNLAQAQVAGNAYPAFRLNQLAVNFHAATTSLYAALGAVEIGSRIRIINVPAAAAPLGTIDLFVEGWTETPTPTTYRVVFDTSPADSPPRGKWDSFRWQCAGQTLNTALSNSPAPVSVVIATTGTGNPTFTTVAGEYPMDIKVGEEIITLAAAPGGSTSPQTFTGCLRGQRGTLVAAQAAGSVIQLYPATAWAL